MRQPPRATPSDWWIGDWRRTHSSPLPSGCGSLPFAVAHSEHLGGCLGVMAGGGTTGPPQCQRRGCSPAVTHATGPQLRWGATPCWTLGMVALFALAAAAGAERPEDAWFRRPPGEATLVPPVTEDELRDHLHLEKFEEHREHAEFMAVPTAADASLSMERPEEGHRGRSTIRVSSWHHVGALRFDLGPIKRTHAGDAFAAEGALCWSAMGACAASDASLTTHAPCSASSLGATSCPGRAGCGVLPLPAGRASALLTPRCLLQATAALPPAWPPCPLTRSMWRCGTHVAARAVVRSSRVAAAVGRVAVLPRAAARSGRVSPLSSARAWRERGGRRVMAARLTLHRRRGRRRLAEARWTGTSDTTCAKASLPASRTWRRPAPAKR